MPPAQTPQPPAGQFDFIMQNTPLPPGGVLPGGRKQLAIWIIIGVIGLIIIVILGAMLFGNKKDATKDMISAISQEQEISRLSIDARTKASDANTRALAATANATLSTDSAALKAYLKSAGKKVDAKMLISASSKNNDKTLADADQQSHYNDAFIKLLAGLLGEYQKTLKTSYDASGVKGKKILTTAYTNSKQLTDSSFLAPQAQ